MTQTRVLVFDLDGTLIDTAPDLAATMNVVLERHNRPALALEEVRHMVGEGARKLMARAWARTGREADEAELDDLFDQFIAYYLAHVSDFSRPFPGLEDVLGVLADSGWLFTICTNKPEGATHALLGALKLDHYFKAVIGGDTLACRKPDPEPVLEAVRRCGGGRANAVMIGDSATDIHAARAAGVPVIAVTYGYSLTPVHEFGPDRLVDQLCDLPDALAHILAPAKS